jgi:hypothetical protein
MSKYSSFLTKSAFLGLATVTTLVVSSSFLMNSLQSQTSLSVVSCEYPSSSSASSISFSSNVSSISDSSISSASSSSVIISSSISSESANTSSTIIEVINQVNHNNLSGILQVQAQNCLPVNGGGSPAGINILSINQPKSSSSQSSTSSISSNSLESKNSSIELAGGIGGYSDNSEVKPEVKLQVKSEAESFGGKGARLTRTGGF